MATVDAVRRLLVSLLPPGATEVYDLDNEDSDVYNLLDAIATLVKVNVSDVLDTLRDEVSPLSASEKVADWETALGLSTTSLAQQGASALTLRRQQVITRLREYGASTIPNIRAALQPLMQYGPAYTIEVVECDRSALRAAHIYDLGSGVLVGPATLTLPAVTVPDTAAVSQGGARLFINITSPAIEELEFVLWTPDGDSMDLFPSTFGLTGALTTADIELHGGMVTGTVIPVDSPVGGDWYLQVITPEVNTSTIHSATFFVEGIGRDSLRNDGLGAAQFDWGVLVDESKVDSAVSPWTMDYAAIDAVIQRWNPAHCIGNVIRVYSGNNAAIPDDTPEIPTNAIPDQCIPG